MHSWEKSAFVGLATAKIGVMADNVLDAESNKARKRDVALIYLD